MTPKLKGREVRINPFSSQVALLLLLLEPFKIHHQPIKNFLPIRNKPSSCVNRRVGLLYFNISYTGGTWRVKYILRWCTVKNSSETLGLGLHLV